MTTGLVLRIERFAVHDGPGIRTVVYLKGCPLRCWWCHSPESQSLDPEPVAVATRCIRCGTCVDTCAHGAIVETESGVDLLRDACEVCGECVEACPTGAREIAGRAMSVGALMDEVAKDQVFFRRSGGGVTFSGGEPLMQAGFLAEALAACRARRLHTAVETSGFAPWSAVEVAAGADLVLYDLKIVDDERHRRFTGVSNRPILENLVRLAGLHRAVRVRVPLVPSVNDDADHLVALGRFVASLGLAEVDLLPYHTAGVAKYNRLGRPYALPDVSPPTPDAVNEARARLGRCGLVVHVGG